MSAAAPETSVGCRSAAAGLRCRLVRYRVRRQGPRWKGQLWRWRTACSSGSPQSSDRSCPALAPPAPVPRPPSRRSARRRGRTFAVDAPRRPAASREARGRLWADHTTALRGRTPPLRPLPTVLAAARVSSSTRHAGRWHAGSVLVPEWLHRHFARLRPRSRLRHSGWSGRHALCPGAASPPGIPHAAAAIGRGPRARRENRAAGEPAPPSARSRRDSPARLPGHRCLRRRGSGGSTPSPTL